VGYTAAEIMQRVKSKTQNPKEIYFLKVSAEFLGIMGMGYEVNVCFTNFNGFDRFSVFFAYRYL
jgi:hypothetical protein